jgi:monofunctional chorismate mutase
MNKLEEARQIINQVDEKMIELFIQRMTAVKQVAQYKLENKLPVLDSSREGEIKAKNLKILNNTELEKFYLEFFDGVLRSSKDYQYDLIEAYQKKNL